MAERKLSNEQSQEVRNLYGTGQYSQRQLGFMFNVSKDTICRTVSDSYKPSQSDEERFWSMVDTLVVARILVGYGRLAKTKVDTVLSVCTVRR